MKKLLPALFLFFVLTATAQVQVNTSLLDTTYNHIGYRVNAPDLFQQLNCSDVDNQGRIVGVFKQAYLPEVTRIFRYDINGQPDNSFGNAGTVEINDSVIATSIDPLFKYYLTQFVKILPDNKILLIGKILNTTGSQNFVQKITVTRLNQDGTTDLSYANNGSFVFTSGNAPGSSPMNIALQPDGKILVLGYTLQGSNLINPLLIRLTEGGNLDSSFSGNGFKIFNSSFYPQFILINQANELLFPHSKAVDTLFSLSIAKFASNGDSILSQDIHLLPFWPNWSTAQIDVNDKITLSIWDYGDSTFNDELAIFRINASLALDNLFGGNGIVKYTDTTYTKIRYNIECMPDGSVYSASCLVRPNVGYSDSHMLIMKYNANGEFDNSFGYNGKYYLSLPSGVSYNTEPVIYRLNNSNKILARGATIATIGQIGSGTFFVARVNIDNVSLILGLIDNPAITQSILAYPNPIQSGELTLSYELTNKQDVAIDLYDIKGQLITRLMPQQTRANGKNTETLTLPQNLSVGQYILRITAGNYQKGVSVVVN